MRINQLSKRKRQKKCYQDKKTVYEMWQRWKSGEKIAELAREYGISNRKAKRAIMHYHDQRERGQHRLKFANKVQRVEEKAKKLGINLDRTQVLMKGNKALEDRIQEMN